MQTPAANRASQPAIPNVFDLIESPGYPHGVHDPQSHDTNTGLDGNGSQAGMTDSVMRTVISSGRDALDVLFTAVEDEQSLRRGPGAQAALPNVTPTPGSTAGVGVSPAVPRLASLSTPEMDVFRIWNACRFVRMGWLSAFEAITYVDL